MELSVEDKGNLLELARKTIVHFIESGKTPTAEELNVAVSANMQTEMAAFVTLKKHGQLRGCIGSLVSEYPLYYEVITRAVNAAVSDPRFERVTAEEIPDLHIEISALTPAVEVDSYIDIEIGKHGVILSKGMSRAVFLPQVAPEQGWDVDETLTHLSLKAGLPADGWREGASFKVFEAIVFGEDD